jgi:hypothetical protein
MSNVVVYEKIEEIRNKILNKYESLLLDDRTYLELDAIKYLPYRLTTLKNFIDLLEKYKDENLLLKIFQVTEKIKLSLREDRTIDKETLNIIILDIRKYEFCTVSGDIQKARDILNNIEQNIYFYKEDIVVVSNKISMISRDLQNDEDYLQFDLEQ